MEISSLKKIILRNLAKLEEPSGRGGIHTLKLWMEFGLTKKKGSDFQKLYRQHQSALELLINSGEVKNLEEKPISSTTLQLTPKGRETIDSLNKNLARRIYSYFEPQIKSELFKFLIWLVTILIAYMAGYLKLFMSAN